MNRLLQHAIDELKYLHKNEENVTNDVISNDEMNNEMSKNILELLEVFSKQGHSGLSANYCIDVFTKLAKFKPLQPIMGTNDEWGEPFSLDGTMQNKRCSHIFKEQNGKAYDIDAIIFYDILPNGSKSFFTCNKSRKYIQFPYTPKSVYKLRLSKNNILNLIKSKL